MTPAPLTLETAAPALKPIAIGADDAARMFSMKRRKWEALVNAKLAPRAFEIAGMRRRVWRTADLVEWARLEFPNRDQFERLRRDDAVTEGRA